MISIEKPDYHGARCNVCGSDHDVKMIRFTNDNTNQGIIVSVCRECRYKLLEEIDFK